jgi:hypothetical protein
MPKDIETRHGEASVDRSVLIMMKETSDPSLPFLLSTQGSHVKQSIRIQQYFSTSTIGRVGVKDLPILNGENAHTRLFTLHSPNKSLPFHCGLVVVIILNGLDGLVLCHMEVIVEWFVEGRIPWHDPPHSFLKGLNLGNWGTGDHHKSGISGLHGFSVSIRAFS